MGTKTTQLNWRECGVSPAVIEEGRYADIGARAAYLRAARRPWTSVPVMNGRPLSVRSWWPTGGPTDIHVVEVASGHDMAG